MLVYSTKLPLKQEISKETCIQLFIEWITESEHYPIDNIPYEYNSNDNYHIEKDGISFSITHYSDPSHDLTACRLENNEGDTLWTNDCIFLQEGMVKTLLIQLNCDRLGYNKQLPIIHKPYIVRKFVEGGFCCDDALLPVIDAPIVSDESTLDICSKIMCNQFKNTMPVVYVSCDYWGHTVLSADYLARQLSGMAHVFVEKKYEIAMKLKEKALGKNVYNKYIGIYFPGQDFCEKFCLDYYDDYRAMSRAIIDSIWSAYINRIDSSVYNWNQIMTLQAKQRMDQWKDSSVANKEELAKYMSSFDSENEELRKKVEALNSQNQNLRMQIDALHQAMESKKTDGFYKLGQEEDIYPGEHCELLYSILSQVQGKYEIGSRGYTIIQSLLQANKPIGECKRILEALKSILSGDGRLNASDKARLKDLGFSIEEDGGSHYKLVFHDSRYMFTVAKTPSDHREGKNLYSDICKVLDITRKIV